MSPLVLEQKPNETQAEYANRAAELDQPVRGDIKRIDPREFQNLGFLQEANRLFFHPLGLALEVVVYDDDSVRFGGVWDYRDDPEGMAYKPEYLSTPEAMQKALNVEAERARHIQARQTLFRSLSAVQEV